MTTTVERFVNEYHSYHDISPGRRVTQHNVLLDFERFSACPIEQTDDAHFRAYLAHLVARGDHVNTVRRKGNMIRPFYGWAFDARVISADTFMRVKRVKNPRGATDSKPRPYERREIIEFWDALDSQWPIEESAEVRWRKGLRTRYYRLYPGFVHAQISAVAHLALHAGMRRNEIFDAELNDLHYDNEYVVVRYAARKNAAAEIKPREIPMTLGMEAALKRWFEIRARIDPDHDRPWLSLSPWSPQGPYVPMPHDSFSEMMAGIGKGYGLHRFRHTCGTMWLRSGMDLEQVQKLLGHARLQQTLAYAEIAKTDLKRHMARTAPDFETLVGRAA